MTEQKSLSQLPELVSILKNNTEVWDIISTAEQLKIPNWFVGAGCIAQTVWNNLHGFEPYQFISDIDFVYYDSDNLSYEHENQIIDKVKRKYGNSRIPLDVKNQARVHLWYNDRFGYKIEKYTDIYNAIDSWPTTATSIAVKKVRGKLEIYAPFGIDDLLLGIVRPNKKQITKEIYKSKIDKWKLCWPLLKIEEW